MIKSSIVNSFGLSMGRMRPAPPAELLQLESFRRLSLVLRGAVIPALALVARQGDDVAHH
jgi:hypothetical protein